MTDKGRKVVRASPSSTPGVRHVRKIQTRHLPLLSDRTPRDDPLYVQAGHPNRSDPVQTQLSLCGCVCEGLGPYKCSSLLHNDLETGLLLSRVYYDRLTVRVQVRDM